MTSKQMLQKQLENIAAYTIAFILSIVWSLNLYDYGVSQNFFKSLAWTVPLLVMPTILYFKRPNWLHSFVIWLKSIDFIDTQMLLINIAAFSVGIILPILGTIFTKYLLITSWEYAVMLNFSISASICWLASSIILIRNIDPKTLK